MRRLGLSPVCFGWFLALLLVPALGWSANEGQKDLDEATDLQLTAETLGDLEKVAELCESALKKGLDDGQTQFAKQLLSSTLYQHAQKSAEAIFAQQPPNPRWPLVRDRALKNLERAIEVYPELPDTYILAAKLQSLPNGDKDKAFAAIDKGIDILKKKDGADKELSQAFLLRAMMQDNPQRQFADLDSAIEADPNSIEPLQTRAFLHLAQENFEKAIPDLAKLVEKDPTNGLASGALSEALMNIKKYDEALKYADKLIEQTPKVALGYSLRARIYVLKDDMDAALKDLNQAIDLDKNDVASLLLRSRVLAALDKTDAARNDIDQALKIRPDLPQAILIRSLLAAEKKRYGEAIDDLQMLLRADPTNTEFRLQLAAYYVADERPRRAIEMLTNILADDESNTDALRSRGDAYLSVSKHAEAIADYKKALKVDPEDTGILNNYAWVLATSTDDDIRDAKKALELAKQACELTEYKMPHILSTLASAYAESGDWENAVKWSTKAVDMSDPEIKEQLQKELNSYKEKKPWRESQNVEENKKPIGAPTDDLET